MEIMNLNDKYVVYPDAFYYDVDTSIIWFRRILTHNKIDETAFIKCVENVMNKSEMKLNSVWLCGATNAGKSLLCNSIVESARFFSNIMEFDERTAFPLNDAPGKRVLLINEPVIADKRIELIKNIMEGQDVAINVKHKKGISLPRTPLIISSNKDLWHYCPSEKQAILNRCYSFKCGTMPELVDCTKKLHPLLWKTLIETHTSTDDFGVMLATICYHRNWKSSYFNRLSSIVELFNSHTHILSETFDAIHFSLKPSCNLCQLSIKVMDIVDPPGDVSDCVACGGKTMYLFCTKCIHVLS